MGLSVIEFYQTRKINLEYFSYILNQTAAFTIQIFTKTKNCSTKLLDQILYQIYRNRQRSIESTDRYPIRSQNNIGRHWADFHETRPSLTNRCKLCYTKFHGNPTNYSVAHTMSRTERRTDRRGLHVRLTLQLTSLRCARSLVQHALDVVGQNAAVAQDPLYIHIVVLGGVALRLFCSGQHSNQQQYQKQGGRAYHGDVQWALRPVCRLFIGHSTDLSLSPTCDPHRSRGSNRCLRNYLITHVLPCVVLRAYSYNKGMVWPAARKFPAKELS